MSIEPGHPLAHTVFRLEHWMNRVTTVMAMAAGGAFLPLAFYMTIDATSRRFGGPFTGVSDEIAGTTLAFGGTWAMAYALHRGAHVRIDVLMPLYPERLREILRVWAIAMTVLLAFVLTINTWHLTYESIIYDARAFSMLGQPLAIGQSLTAIGFTMLTLQAVLMLVTDVLRLFVGAGAPPEGDGVAGRGG